MPRETPRMAHDLPLACACGTIRGTLAGASPKSATRVICYCDDCQTYALHLGRAEELLDAHGGTDITQVKPSSVSITNGRDRLMGLRQSPKGALRVYADCCKTPIANLGASPKMPWVGLVHAFADHGETPRDDVFGPPRARVNGKFATGDTSQLDGLHPKMPAKIMFRIMPRLARWRLGGAWKNNPFFGADQRPRMNVVKMSKEERARLKQALA